MIRERGGRVLPSVVAKESDGVALVRKHVATGSIVRADKSRAFDRLHASYYTKRINHSIEYASDEACTNQAESYFSPLRRAEIGQHHHISGKYLGAYATEMASCENNRRVSNGGAWTIAAGAALAHPVSRQGIGSDRRC